MYRRSWRTYWIIWTATIVLCTTLLFSDVQSHSHWGRVRWIPFQDFSFSYRSLSDVLANLLLFIPFGYLCLRTSTSGQASRIVQAILLAVSLAVCVELFQVFTHNRVPSMTDIVTDAAGAGIGAAFALKAATKNEIPKTNGHGTT